MKFEFSCKEILDAIGVEIEKAQKEYTSQEKYIHGVGVDSVDKWWQRIVGYGVILAAKRGLVK